MKIFSLKTFLYVLGLSILISPAEIDKAFFLIMGIMLIAVVIISLIFMRQKFLVRGQGFILLLMYFLFLAIQISYVSGKGIFFGII